MSFHVFITFIFLTKSMHVVLCEMDFTISPLENNNYGKPIIHAGFSKWHLNLLINHVCTNLFSTCLFSSPLNLQVDSYDLRVDEDLGDIVLVKIEKKKYWVLDDWYCKYITVKTPSGDYVEFPCFHWLVDDKEVVLRDGRGNHHLSFYPIDYLLLLFSIIRLHNKLTKKLCSISHFVLCLL